MVTVTHESYGSVLVAMGKQKYSDIYSGADFMGRGGTVSRRTAIKKLTKLY